MSLNDKKKFVVFYNGDKNIPEQSILRLSDAFMDSQKKRMPVSGNPASGYQYQEEQTVKGKVHIPEGLCFFCRKGKGILKLHNLEVLD